MGTFWSVLYLSNGCLSERGRGGEGAREREGRERDLAPVQTYSSHSVHSDTWYTGCGLSCTVTERCAAILAVSQSSMMCKHTSQLHGQWQRKRSYLTSRSAAVHMARWNHPEIYENKKSPNAGKDRSNVQSCWPRHQINTLFLVSVTQWCLLRIDICFTI